MLHTSLNFQCDTTNIKKDGCPITFGEFNSPMFAQVGFVRQDGSFFLDTNTQVEISLYQLGELIEFIKAIFAARNKQYKAAANAAEVASKWHGGNWSALYQFASSSEYLISNHLRYLQEIEACLHPEYNLHPSILTKKDKKELEQIKTFFIETGHQHKIETVYASHPLYGYSIPWVARNTAEDIAKQITPLKYNI